jgi:thiamine biosynthesis lipoprotein
VSSKLSPRAYRALVIASLLALGAVAAWQTAADGPPPGVARQREPSRVMGTSCRLVVFPPRGDPDRDADRVTEAALANAEAALRQVEIEMSTWIEATPVSRFNRAPAGVLVPLPASVVHVLRESQIHHTQSDGAFDVTCRPLIELWRAAGESGRAPTQRAIASARAASTWDAIHLTDAGATKTRPGVRVDLGGIAKGYAIDRAIDAMRDAGAAGGLVDVGGDVRVFGTHAGDAAWDVQLRDPSGEGVAGALRIPAGAVCTSGDYFRFVEIEGRRFSHIVDPRTGRPAQGVRSATVVAPNALTADAWATALSVLGEAGLARLPRGVEALLILGERESPRAVGTAGFEQLIAAPLGYPATFH